jgi:hypothetical protein
MTFNEKLNLWPILPFGGESQESDSSESNEMPVDNSTSKTNPVVAQGNSEDNSSDEDDPYAGLSSKELRRLLRDTETSKSSTEAAKAELEKKIKDAEDAQLSKEQKLEKDVTERDSVIATLRAANAKLAIINAINEDSRYQWHNPEVVAQQLSSAVVKVSDEGKVEGIAKELARIAKDHDYLLKTKGTQQNSNGQQKSDDQGPTGFQPGQGGANQGGTLTNTTELAKNYPALANRI